MHSSPRVRPTLATGSPSLAPIPEPVASRLNGKLHDHTEGLKKSTVRIDAFLGEWLSPDYFEQITPPPSSIMMVAGAKAELLRREDYSTLSHVREPSTASANQGFPGGWGSPVVFAEKDKDEGALSSLSTLGQPLPRRDRTSSLSSIGSSRSSHGGTVKGGSSPDHGVYHPPVPSYAISGSDPIPPGYVAHSRDACVDVDYQWDSMREPQKWGTGGEYDEEWSAMHKRFRKGLQQLVGWYSEGDDPAKLMTNSAKKSGHLGDAEDEDTDLVIILVTHGAGCNALIGALTNQPVLLDVGMASLTMAVRKPTPVNSPATSPTHSRASSRTVLISEQYDVKLVANTEHLRNTTSTPSSRSPSLAGLPAFRESFRERYAVNSGSLDGTTFPKSRPTSSGNFGSIRRTPSAASSVPRNYAAPQSSLGLWSPTQARDEEEADEEPEDDMFPRFEDELTNTTEKLADIQIEAIVPEKEEEPEAEEDEVAPLGLWGSPRPPGHAEKIREIAPKRRWTVHERN